MLKIRKITLRMSPVIGRAFLSEPLKENADMNAPMRKIIGEAIIINKIGRSSSYMIMLRKDKETMTIAMGRKAINIPTIALAFLFIPFLEVWLVGTSLLKTSPARMPVTAPMIAR